VSIISGNSTSTKRRGLSTVELLIKVARYVKKADKIFNVKSSWSKLVSTRRSTVQNLPSQLGVPG